ncbi:MAG: hypothetical protein WKF73_18040 [Nocardioidaceae bacterium]
MEVSRWTSESVSTIVSTGLQFIERFGRSEELCAHVVTIALTATEDSDIERTSDADADRIREEIERFTATWPNSPYLRSLSFEDSTDALRKLADAVRESDEERLLRRNLMRQVAAGRIPVAIIAAFSGRTYSETLIRRVSAVPARGADFREERECIRAFIESVNCDVVADNSTGVVLNLLPVGTRDALVQKFRRVLTSRDAVDDARNCERLLGDKNCESLVYDHQQSSVRLISISPEEAERCNTDAAALVRLLQTFHVSVRPELRVASELQHERHDSWLAGLDIAAESSVALWCDDVAIRAVARHLNIPTFSTVSLLQYLAMTGDISEAVRSESMYCLFGGQVADLSLSTQTLLEYLDRSSWSVTPGHTTYLAHAASWLGPSSATSAFIELVKLLRVHKPDDIPKLFYAAAHGIALPASNQNGAAQLVGILISGTLLNLETTQMAPTILEIGRQIIRELHAPLDGGNDSDSDPLPSAVRAMRDILTPLVPNGMATSFVMASIAHMEQADRDIAARALLRIE